MQIKIDHIAKSRKFLTGFTLIELLVVIAIIGLLATIVAVSVNHARQKARDAKRINDLKQFSTALELCYDKLGSYAINGETVLNTPCSRETLQDNDFMGSPCPPYCSGWQQKCSEFLNLPPTDPSGYNYIIHNTADYQHYVLLAQLETNTYAMSQAQILNFVQSVGITAWTPCANFNYVIGY